LSLIPANADALGGCRTRRSVHQEIGMSNQTIAREQAETRFKKQERLAEEGSKAMADYEAAGRATREKTARLRLLRLAHEAAKAQQQAAQQQDKPAPKMPRIRKASTATSRATPSPRARTPSPRASRKSKALPTKP
jgi:hypothetical protein